jgi:hypothetical protein
MNEPKLHHYVPRLYLSNFLNSDQRLWVYDKLTDRTFEAGLTKVAAERDFYRLPESQHQVADPLSIETAFSQLESRVAPMLARLVREVRAGAPKHRVDIPPDERVLLSEFLAAQHFRTLESRELLLFLLADLGHIPDELTQDMQKAIQFTFLSESGVIEELAESIHNAIWLFAKNVSNVPLVTSDHPICVKRSDNRMWIKGFDPLVDGRYVVFPLTPDIVLYCKERSKWGAIKNLDSCISPIELDAGMVEHENCGQAFMASRFIFSKSSDFGALRAFIPSIGTTLYATDQSLEAAEAVQRTVDFVKRHSKRR